MAEAAPDFEVMTEVQRKIWSQGDFAKIGNRAQIVGERLCEAVDVIPGERVLDVACGSGNAAIAAARRFGEAVGVDYVPELLSHGRERAEADGLEVEFVEGDAQALPFQDASFDVVLSTFGAMFAPDQPQAAGELLRVTKSDGRIGMANWTPDGIVFFEVIAKHAPMPPGIDPPVLWGTEERLRELFGVGISDLKVEKRIFNFRYRSPAHFIEVFRTWYGPVHKAFAALPAEGAAALEKDLTELMKGLNRGGPNSLVVPSDYLEIVVTRR